jgi:pimeloyl-ACP methyl ester carboxylesterase
MAEAAPAGYAVLIDGHRHMVNLTAPEEVNAILLEWLKKPEEMK